MATTKRVLAALFFLLLASCSYVIRKDLMEETTRNPDLAVLDQSPDECRNDLFVLGGIVTRTALTPQGLEIEALYVPVDSRGRAEEASISGRRFLAIYPNELGVLAPRVYGRDRSITIAAAFVGTTRGTADKREYALPVFKIAQIHSEERYVEAYPYYPKGYWGPGWWGTYP